METLSNHGTAQGVIPRFHTQIDNLASMVFGKSFEKKSFDFLKENLSDFTDFYDIHAQIISTYNKYVEGLKSGELFSPEDAHSPIHDRGTEIELRKLVKDFFIVGKQLLNNFAKSGFIDDGDLKMSEVMFAKQDAFAKKRKQINAGDGPFYEILFSIMEHYRKNVTIPFLLIRNEYEHNNYRIEPFKVYFKNGLLVIDEPKIDGYNFLQVVNFYYDEIFNYIELLMVYFFGINAYHKYKGNLTLFESESFDYPKLRYRYYIYPKIFGSGYRQLITP